MKTIQMLKIGFLALLLASGAGTALAGPLVPPGPPLGVNPDGPTMKSLNEVPPNWHQTLRTTQHGDLFGITTPCDSERFRCVLPLGTDGAAVLDLETGLVWQRSPSPILYRWGSAADACYANATGLRLGWRLPRVEELATLSDPAAAFALFEGSPIAIGATPSFWTTTPDAADVDKAYFQFFGALPPATADKTLLMRVWCVRSPNGSDAN